MPLVSYHFTLVQNIKRDPFEQAVTLDGKTALGVGGALASPSTAYLYDWNILPIGQQLWLKELESYNTRFRRCKPLRVTTSAASSRRSRKPTRARQATSGPRLA